MPQVSKFALITNGKCPRCGSGSMFQGTAYSSKAFEMNERCPNCDLKFEIQPGFWFGATYVTYAIVVGVFAISSLILAYFDLFDSIWLYIVTPGVVILLLPLIFRYSRIVFLHLFGGIKFENQPPE